ncbi:MAG TPA: ABC transporter permease subunit [Erysipelothrix sp.]|jgi:arabinogalactan oligomer/maltooligosaccharide transport system permease protein|nr:ABC transporter permease subunit [Erysipelothrix sp.]
MSQNTLELNKKKFHFGRFLLAFLSYLWLIFMVIACLLPVLWMISAAFTQGRTLDAVPILPDPSRFTTEHFEFIFSYKSNTGPGLPDYQAAFVRTLILAVINTVGVIVVAVISGYVFSRLRFKGKKPLLLGMMVLQMFPSFMGMLALFFIFDSFGWLDSPNLIALIYIAGSIPYNTFLIRGFMQSIPRSLDEAAEIDGATKMQTLRKILLPLIVPIIGFIAINAFMTPWMDYMLQSVFLQDKTQTVSMWLFRTTDPFNTLYYNPLRFMAGALLISIPIMAIQFYMQRFMVHGLTAGADKG